MDARNLNRGIPILLLQTNNHEALPCCSFNQIRFRCFVWAAFCFINGAFVFLDKGRFWLVSHIPHFDVHGIAIRNLALWIPHCH